MSSEENLEERDHSVGPWRDQWAHWLICAICCDVPRKPCTSHSTVASSMSFRSRSAFRPRGPHSLVYLVFAILKYAKAFIFRLAAS